jgi:hypothetical protein
MLVAMRPDPPVIVIVAMRIPSSSKRRAPAAVPPILGDGRAPA